MSKKLHEVLGAQGPAATQLERVKADLLTTFEKKRHLFGETIVRFIPDSPDEPPRVESQSTLQTTVPSELAWLTGIWAKALDTAAMVDEGNMSARASITLEDGTVLVADVPATQLLQLDKRLMQVHDLIAAIPTLDPAKGFVPAPDRGKGVSVAREDRRRRTRKEQVPLTLVAPTKEHPGQAVLISKDIEIGTIESQEWSGLITPATKAAMLERSEALRTAVKTARARANDTKVDDVKIGRTLLEWVFAPALDSAR